MNSLLDVEELAKYLKLQKQTIYNWLNQRKISGMKITSIGKNLPSTKNAAAKQVINDQSNALLTLSLP